jgi:hypothetical protein
VKTHEMIREFGIIILIDYQFLCWAQPVPQWSPQIRVLICPQNDSDAPTHIQMYVALRLTGQNGGAIWSLICWPDRSEAEGHIDDVCASFDPTATAT